MRTKILFILIFGFSLAQAYTSDDIKSDYAKEAYKKVCLESADYYKNGGKDEELLSLIGDACLKSDFINPLGYIIKNLISSPESRQNASYFATVFLQKKLIYQFVNDGLDLSHMRLPQTDHILSVVFQKLATKEYSEIDGKFIIELPKGAQIIIYKLVKNDLDWVILEEYQDKMLIKKHWYI